MVILEASSFRFSAIALLASAVVSVLFVQRQKKKNSKHAAPFTEKIFYPPLPEPIVGMLK